MSTLPKLALIPSGYKASKVYSTLPTNGDGDFTFSRTGTATRVNKDGLIETVGSNVPRLDYLDNTCPSLLLEPQRTNETTYSQDFTQTSYWNNVIDVVVTKNEAIAPDGTFTANKIQSNSGTNFKILRVNAFTIPSGITMSMFVKRGNHDYIIFKAQGDYWFNLSNLTWGGSYSNVGYEDYGNDWIRLYATTTSSILSYFGIYLSDSSFNQYWTATGNEFVYVWGGQYETGSYPTSYIKTVGSTVTRLKDECINGGNSDLFDITEGTFFVDVTPFKASDFFRISLSNGTGDEEIIYLFVNNNSQVTIISENSGVGQVSYTANITFGTRNKLAFTFKNNEFKFYVNGSLEHTDTSGAITEDLNVLHFAGNNGAFNFFQGKVHDTRVYDRVLTDAELISLTT